MTLNISKHINDLLYNHECVIVSGLGAFIVNKEETVIDQKRDYFSPNKKSISFNSQIKKNDGLLANYISETENISYEEACIHIAKFTKNILLKINNGENIQLESIGNLKINSIGEIIFDAYEKINYDPDFFGLDSFYFPKIQDQKKFIPTQYISSVVILFVFISIGFFLSENISGFSENSNTASFNPNIMSNVNTELNEVSGLYKINVAQIDYDLYKIIGTNYHLSTKRCFKMGHEIEAQLKIFNDGKIKKRELCFLNELGLEFNDCYQIKNVYNQIPTTSKNLIVVDKRGRMRNAILVFEETIIDYTTLTNIIQVDNSKDEKNDIASRFLEAVKELSEKSNIENSKTPSNKNIQVEEEIIILENSENIENTEELTTKAKNVFIIVGCFSSETNAKKLVSQLNKKGFNDACIAGRSSNRKLFRVACSKFETVKDANKNLKNLQKKFQGAWVLNNN